MSSGATSSALLLRFFRSIGGNIGVYIPDRRKEGYGPNTAALLKLKQEGAAVVVTDVAPFGKLQVGPAPPPTFAAEEKAPPTFSPHLKYEAISP